MMNTSQLIFKNVISLAALLMSINVTYADEHVVKDTIYVNGGIGEEEANEMRAKAGAYNLRLYMSEGNQAQFIAGTKITIIDKKGNVVLDEQNAGPMLFVYVANGTYIINAMYKEIGITRKVVVSNRRGENVYLVWKVSGTNVEKML